ncbi:MAG: peptide ABC transporter ATP-binding protein [Rhizobiales bacterium]|nr:peptide ABC transporter ATP-binding protein [Hyphomicrobiales bacterium]
MSEQTLLEVQNLSLRLRNIRAGGRIVDAVSFGMGRGEIVGIVGESGSGKTMLARSIIGLQPDAIVVEEGDITLKGQSVGAMNPRELRKIRGAEVSMVFQEPMISLNPSMKIGRQLDEPLRVHTDLQPAERVQRCLEIMRQVGISDPESGLEAYPHQFSGGMRQRIMLASAMLLRPSLLIADEPTTALDAIIQRQVLELMIDLTQSQGTALLMISHDLPMVARYCQRILVMRQGQVVESGPTADILARPQHDYTRALLQSMPGRGPKRGFSPDAAPLVAVRDLEVEYKNKSNPFRPRTTKKALKGVSITIRPGEVLAVVGASGSGKTTLGRTIAGLTEKTAGEVLFRGQSIEKSQSTYAEYRLNCQMIFQDPFGSLNPRMKVGQLVAEALRHEKDLSAKERHTRVIDILAEVGLGEQFLDRFPHELSGGQRQRIAIARAIVRRPEFVVADEAVSALDVTVRAQVLDLLADLQKRYNFSCLFISHDLAVVEKLADRVVVMRDGEIVEQGLRDEVFDNPKTDYTRALLSAIPMLERTQTGVNMRWRFDQPETTGLEGQP